MKIGAFKRSHRSCFRHGEKKDKGRQKRKNEGGEKGEEGFLWREGKVRKKEVRKEKIERMKGKDFNGERKSRREINNTVNKEGK